MRLVALVLLLAACDGNGDGGGADGGDGGGSDGGGSDGEERVARAVARLASCGVGRPAYTAADLLREVNEDDLACALAAADCEDVLACFGFRVAEAGCPAEDTCLDDGTLWTCAGGTLGGPLEIDCAAWHGNGGAMCVEGTGGAGACGAGTCAGDDTTCDGTRLEKCINGVLTVRDCADRGLTCWVASDSETVCADADSGATCAAEDDCDGETLVECENDLETRIDCSAHYLDATCVQRVGSTGVMCGYGDDCEIDLQDPGACEGNALTFCMLGRSVSVDCTEIGFDGCSMDPPGPACR